jgi:hypothetical protein
MPSLPALSLVDNARIKITSYLKPGDSRGGVPLIRARKNTHRPAGACHCSPLILLYFCVSPQEDQEARRYS